MRLHLRLMRAGRLTLRLAPPTAGSTAGQLSTVIQTGAAAAVIGSSCQLCGVGRSAMMTTSSATTQTRFSATLLTTRTTKTRKERRGAMCRSAQGGRGRRAGRERSVLRGTQGVPCAQRRCRLGRGRGRRRIERRVCAGSAGGVRGAQGCAYKRRDQGVRGAQDVHGTQGPACAQEPRTTARPMPTRAPKNLVTLQ
jgi:hypothetical protein